MKQNLQKYIFYSFLSGIILGILLNNLSNYFPEIFNIILNILQFGGEIFLKIIKMLVVPIVFFSLLIGVANLKNISTLGRIGAKTLIFIYIHHNASYFIVSGHWIYFKSR